MSWIFPENRKELHVLFQGIFILLIEGENHYTLQNSSGNPSLSSSFPLNPPPGNFQMPSIRELHIPDF